MFSLLPITKSFLQRTTISPLCRLRAMSTAATNTTSVTVADRLHDILTQTFTPDVIDIYNESSGHAVPKGSETHFRVVVVSNKFQSVLPVQRHRMVYTSVTSLMRPSDANPSSTDYFHRIHALAIVAKTPEEWEKTVNKESLLLAPKCLGGEKKERAGKV